MQPKPLLSFWVDGVAQPRGSKISQPLYKNGKPIIKEGRVVTVTRDDNPKSGEWMQDVARAARFACRQAGLTQLVDGPLVLRVVIYRARNLGHFNKGQKVKPKAPAFPATKPDLTKMIRGIEDALESIVFRNDSQIVDQQTSKRWGERAGVRIELFTLPSTVAEADTWNQNTLL